MDTGSISMSVSAVTNIINQVKLLKNLTSEIEKATEIQEAKQKAIDLTNIIIDLQNAVMSMQSDYMRLMEENGNLKKIRDESEDYQLVKYPTKDILTKDVLVYEYKGNKNPKHYCCPICFGKGTRSVLQQIKNRVSLIETKEFFECDICSKKYYIARYVENAIKI